MIGTSPIEVAEIVIGNHLASLAVYAISHNPVETLNRIEDLKKELARKMVDILDPTKGRN